MHTVYPSHSELHERGTQTLTVAGEYLKQIRQQRMQAIAPRPRQVQRPLARGTGRSVATT